MTTDLFTKPQSQQNDQLPEIDPNKNYLEELVGEGRKYKTVEDLAKAQFHANSYIPHLNREMDELREFTRSIQQDRTERANLEQRLTELQNMLTSSGNTPDANEETPKPSNLDPQQLEEILEKKLTEREKLRKEEENYNTVVEKLKERYGSDYVRSLQEDTESLGLTPDYVNELARKSPKALFRTLGFDQPKGKDLFQAPPTTDRRSGTFTPSGSDKRTWSYYQNLKKENPLVYLDPKIQVQMHKDRLALGEAFNDG